MAGRVGVYVERFVGIIEAVQDERGSKRQRALVLARQASHVTDYA